MNRRSVLVGAAAWGGVAAINEARSGLDMLLAPQKANSGKPVVNVRDFRAFGDGRSDDRAAIQAAIDTLAHSGGGTVIFPAGTYLVSSAGRSAVAITLKSNIVLEGQGKSSVLKLRDGAGGHLVNVTRETNCTVRKMVLDGNRNHQQSMGHAFRSGGANGLRLEDLEIRNAFHYGIGLEAGANRNVTISRVVIRDCGGDGIDIKNKTNSNANVLITDVTIRRWGLRGGTQAGIDCRGPVRLSRIKVSDPGAADAVGIRMRQGESRDANGLGAHHAQVQGFDVRMGSGRAQIGINVVARDVSLSKGSISGGFRGLLVQDSGFQANGIRVSGCSGTGIVIDAHGSGLDADGAILSNDTAIGCGASGIEVEADNVQILNCVSTGNGRHGLVIAETAQATRVVGGNFSKNRAGPIAKHGKRTRTFLSAA